VQHRRSLQPVLSKCQASAKDAPFRCRPTVFEAPDKGTIDFWDSSLPAFGCRVSQGGSKTFILKLHNSRRAIGRWPIISLAQARAEAKKLLAEKTLGKIRPQSITYPAAVEVFLEEKRRSRRARTVSDFERHLNLLPFRGQLADISHADLDRQLRKLHDTPGEYNHRLQNAKTFFTWCQKKRYITDNPVTGLSQHAQPSRSRVLTDGELKAVWKAADQIGGHFAAIVKLLLLTGQRRGEIAALRTSWIENDHIVLPKEICKNSREHAFPIGPMSAALISRAMPTSGLLFFPARGRPTSPFNGWSKSKAVLDALSAVADWTLHDLRRTFATNMAQLGVAPHVVEKLLNHVTGTISGVAGIYNRFAYENEMCEAMNKWEARVSALIV
jgi:integrase